MATLYSIWRLWRVEAASRALLRGLHTSSSRLNSNRTSIACLARHQYARLYPILLVRPDGSTIQIRYKEPRQILQIPLDINTLPEAERRLRLRRGKIKKFKPEVESTFDDDFKLDDYRKFWSKK